MKATALQPGTVIAGTVISELLNPAARDRRSYRYRIIYDCCGSTEILTGKALKQRQARGSQYCRVCALKVTATNRIEQMRAEAAALVLAESAPEPFQLPPLPTHILIDANGHHWPALGRLGPRWASGETNSRIGTGRPKRG